MRQWSDIQRKKNTLVCRSMRRDVGTNFFFYLLTLERSNYGIFCLHIVNWEESFLAGDLTIPVSISFF